MPVAVITITWKRSGQSVLPKQNTRTAGSSLILGEQESNPELEIQSNRWRKRDYRRKDHEEVSHSADERSKQPSAMQSVSQQENTGLGTET
jgi:hypothetical protein